VLTVRCGGAHRVSSGQDVPAVLRGYLLEGCLPGCLRNAGYRLLVSESDDSEALEMDGQTLQDRGSVIFGTQVGD
jgi:hypothetical protein